MKTSLEWAEEFRVCMQHNWCELEMRCAADLVTRVRAEMLHELTELLATISGAMGGHKGDGG